MADLIVQGTGIEGGEIPEGCPPRGNEPGDGILVPPGYFWEGHFIRWFNPTSRPYLPDCPWDPSKKIAHEGRDGETYGRLWNNSKSWNCVIAQPGSYEDIEWRGGVHYQYRIPSAFPCIYQQGGGGQHFIDVASATLGDLGGIHQGDPEDDEWNRCDWNELYENRIQATFFCKRGGDVYGRPLDGNGRPTRYATGGWQQEWVNTSPTQTAGNRYHVWIRWWHVLNYVTGYPGAPSANPPWAIYLWYHTSTTANDPYTPGEAPHVTWLLPLGLGGHPIGRNSLPANMDETNCPSHFYIDWFDVCQPISKPVPWSGGPM